MEWGSTLVDAILEEIEHILETIALLGNSRHEEAS
jgi:hypothetical protein